MKTRIIITFVSLAFILTLFFRMPVSARTLSEMPYAELMEGESAFADEEDPEVKEYKFGENVTGKFWPGIGVLMITGNGPMYDNSDEIEFDQAKILDIRCLQIMSGVTSINSKFFSMATNMESLDISETIEKIEDFTFSSCSGLKYVSVLGDDLKIGMFAFLAGRPLSFKFYGNPPTLDILPFTYPGNVTFYYSANNAEWTEEKLAEFSSMDITCIAEGFKDVPTTAYYYNAANWALNNYVTSGTGNGNFSPNEICTRGQIVTFLYRAFQGNDIETSLTFDDVHTTDFFYRPVKWAVINGITAGVDSNHFGPQRECTRAQAMTFIWRAAGCPKAKAVSTFSDVPIDSFYARAVAWAVSEGITSGIGNNKFGPNETCTRAQIVTFLYRYFN